MNHSERKVGGSPQSRKSNKTRYVDGNSPVDYSLTYGIKDRPVEHSNGRDNTRSDVNFS